MHSNQKNVITTKKCLGEGNIQLIADKLNTLLEKSRISTKVLSEATGVSIPLINNLKRGEGNPTIGTLNAISNFFSITLSELLGLDNAEHDQKNIKTISLFDLRFCHERTTENCGNKILIEVPKNTNADTLFGVVVNNNALLPFYEKGSIFILTNNQSPVDGDIVLTRIQNRSNGLKRLLIKKDLFYLKNINIEDSIESYEKDDVEMLGVVTQIIQRII